MSPLQKAFLTAGITLTLVAFAWPALIRLGIGRLPGDIRIEREGFSLYIPVTSMILVSLGLTLILRWLRK